MDENYIASGSYFINQITHDSLESVVWHSWIPILGSLFTVFEGYGVSGDANIEAQRVDMKVSCLVNRDPKTFLGLQLRRPSYSNSPDALRAAEAELMGYLEALPDTDEEKLWGAVCIGKDVQFYKVKLAPLELTVLHDEMLHIDRQPQTVTQWLLHIKGQATWS
ncbi:hypothetical protein ACJZ2D_005581 [Fusarium nematophilum]